MATDTKDIFPEETMPRITGTPYHYGPAKASVFNLPADAPSQAIPVVTASTATSTPSPLSFGIRAPFSYNVPMTQQIMPPVRSVGPTKPAPFVAQTVKEKPQMAQETLDTPSKIAAYINAISTSATEAYVRAIEAQAKARLARRQPMTVYVPDGGSRLNWKLIAGVVIGGAALLYFLRKRRSKR